MQTQLAFLVGIKNYETVQSLRTPLNDVDGLKNLLENQFGYKVFTSVNPTLSALTEFTDKMIAESAAVNALLPANEPLSVIFYFAGHGKALDTDEGINGYLIPADAKRNDPDSWFPMSKLVDTIDALECRHSLVMLDCCFSGSLRWANKYRDIGGLARLEETLYKQHFDYFRDRKSSQVLTSAAHDQLALDFVRGDMDTEHSPFAQCILNGLEKNADSVPDRVITCAELFAYLQNHLMVISGKYGKPQNASLFQLDQHNFGEYMFYLDEFDPDTLKLLEYRNPYRGLSAYEKEHQSFFFGRSEAIKNLLSEVEKNQLTVVLGASGTGKSSLVKAGIIPELKGVVKVIKPGLNPLTELPDATDFDILVIDQFEQLVTQTPETDAIQFLEKIAVLLQNGKKIIATLRIDYEHRLPQIELLKDYWKRFIVPPFSAEELREVIVTPSFRYGRFIEPITLVDRIIDDVIHYPGSLPLLSFTMRQLYDRDARKQNYITPEDYEALGGVIGALQSKADEVYNRLPDGSYQETMRCLVLRMVALTGGQAAGRRVLEENLEFTNHAENDRLKYVRNLLIDERLVVSGTDNSNQVYLEPAHDALVNTWTKVLEWVKNWGDANLLLHNELEAAVTKYHREGMRSKYLWHGSPSLEQISTVENQLLLNKHEASFLLKSRRKRRFNNWLIVFFVSVVILSLVVFALFLKISNSKNIILVEKNNITIDSLGIANKRISFQQDSINNLQKQKDRAKYESFIKDAKSAREGKYYAEARKAYENALYFTKEQEEISFISAEIYEMAKEKNNHEFERNKALGLAIKKTGDNRAALKYLKLAYESVKNDSVVNAAIKDCTPRK